MAQPKLYESNADRQAAYRDRKGRTVTLILAPEVHVGLVEYVARRHMDGEPVTLSQAVEDLIRKQLMRKR